MLGKVWRKAVFGSIILSMLLFASFMNPVVLSSTHAEEAELLLTGPNWLIPNLYTQLAQPLTIQFCARSSLGDLEIHSAKVTVPVYPSLKHDGVQIGVDVAAPFDAYIAYMDQRLAEILEEI